MSFAANLGNTGALLDAWSNDQRQRGLLPSSIKARRVHLVVIANAWDGDLLDVTIEAVQQILDERTGRDGGPISTRTRYCYLSSLTEFFQWAKRAGHVAANPMDDVQRPKRRPLLPRPMADDERDRAFHGCRNDPRMTLWLLLASGAGLRVSEIANLEATDIVRSEPVWHLRAFGKGEKDRWIPIHEGVRYALEHYGIPARGPLFRSSTGRQYDGQRISHLMCSYLDRMGIDGRPHSLRHWFGTELCGNGEELRVVQELMGHSSPVTTAGYTKVRPQASMAAVSRLAL